MKIRNIILIATLALASSQVALAQKERDIPRSDDAGNDYTATDKFVKWGTRQAQGVNVKFTAGYAIGGTTPMPLPAEIRTIGKFKPNGGYNVGAEVSKMFHKRWGVTLGAHFFSEGMETGADVKGYHMGITMDEDQMEGYFTGTDVTKVKLQGFTIPLRAVFRANHRWTIEAGPYAQILCKKRFYGKVYNGYLRVDTPIGEKVNILGTPATYDFSDDLRSFQCGASINVDWKATHHWSVFGNLDWGIPGVFRSDFKTIEFKMHSVYATLGVAYSIF